MQAQLLDRRRFLVGTAWCAAGPWPVLAQAQSPAQTQTQAQAQAQTPAQASAQPLGQPAGPVVLTLSGTLRHRNTAQGADFDLAMLQALPRHSINTRTPWYSKQPRKFTGVLLRELLEAVGGQATAMHATALNAYSADIPAADWTDYDALLAYWLDDKPMSVREMGPLVVIFPFDALPQLRTAVHYGRSIWQLRRIELR